ncbi:enoyl-CoA hydratase-related protein [Maricaulis salignorans]|uniref:Enoyl-CoA hydratase/carnithine racemase n=1 Tax=Maricaulis salignorans TaxID=144026 RepID=A0A1G9MSN0_9PROT|nr:enoyl-CoA hydratase-related protein [Maricaulis salignorans]SDL77302.1 Enoyl-CoA hydratase/carnithine racemase [Maricaulis salignorans]
MAFNTITYAVEDHVATITLNRPHRLNAFTYEMGDELIAAFDASDADDDVRAVIVTGEPPAFCAGADLSMGAETFDLIGQSQQSGAFDDTDPKWRDAGGKLNLRIWDSLKPVIGAINGASVGIGATMILPMDIRLASIEAKFAYPFARRGIVWDGCASWFLPRVVGISTAMDWGLSGRTFSAAEAFESGLVTRVVPAVDLMPEARKRASEIVDRCAPVSVALMRRMAWRMLGASHPMEAHRVETRGILQAGIGPDAKEGVMSFLEKRTPDFPLRVSSDLPDWHPWWDSAEDDY